MKKLLTVILALAMVSAMSVTAFAATIDQSSEPKTGDTTILTSINPTYTVTIPDTVNVAYGDTTTDAGAITLTAAQIEPNHEVTVSAQPGVFANTADSTKTLPYTLKINDTDASSVAFDTKDDAAAMKIEITTDSWNTAFAGSYNGIITFTVAYGEVQGN